ncbi:MAG: methionine synthase [Campylobacterales bacterium]|nr:methionine synthase [Campylobacterales bacterium]
MNIQNKILDLISKRALIIDGAMGTQLQTYKVDDGAWLDENGVSQEGCNELLNATAPEILEKIHNAYAMAGANLITTNTFGTMPWVLDEYGMGHRAYELSKLGAQHVKKTCLEYDSVQEPRFVLGSIGPGTKLPSLGHIDYDTMYEGYVTVAKGLVDGGVDIFLLETCQDPLQIKVALHALQDTAPQIPVMVSVTIELSGSMLIGTDAQTIAAIMEPFNILSLGFNCGTGPEQVKKHLQILSEVCSKPLSIHANAGLPQNRGGYTYYPMGPDEFATLQKEFLNFSGVSFLGGCCGTTPQHIKALKDKVAGIVPKVANGFQETSLASLFQVVSLKQNPSPLLIGERSNATGSKAFRELLKAEDYEGTLTVAQQQVRAGAHVIDVSVGFAGRDESKDMQEVISRYTQKISLPLMPDSTQTKALEIALKNIGGKPIINSVNLEDGIEKFDKVCSLAKKFGASLVCLVIDEIGMAKTKERKVEIAERIYQMAVNNHGIKPEDLVFDMLVFTVGSGDEEYRDAAIQTIEAIREFTALHPEVGTTLGLSNISFGLQKDARIYLNSVFLHHCVEAGLSSAIVNVQHIVPIASMKEDDLQVCEDLLFDNRANGDPLFKFIAHFENINSIENKKDEGFELLSDEQKIQKLLKDGDKQRLIPLALELKDTIAPEIIVNEWLIDGMKEIGELFGSGKMQLPFVLQSAETMKACVDSLNPFLPKIEKKSETTLILGTVKGDVHDVGKNLVDIILSNNGFKVVNIGIKANIEEFIAKAKEYDADAIGMSGLLVKSTNEMKANLEVLQDQGINIPVLLGGAALTKAFVDDFCRPIYNGPIFYARDAFDGVLAMQRIEQGGVIDTRLPADLIVVNESSNKKEKRVFDPATDTPILLQNTHSYNPPFWGRREISKSFSKELAFEWINHRVLFRQRWGYSRGDQDKESFLKYEKEVVQKIYYDLKDELLQNNIFDPIVLYGYYPCKSNDHCLEIYDESKTNVIATFDFPRQGNLPHRSIADYFKNDEFDVVALSFVSSGLQITQYEREFYDNGNFTKYYQIHGLGVELAEALAELVHKQIRMDLGITHKEKPVLSDVVMKHYQGCRYSPGYAACPDLAQNRTIFDLLCPEEFGVSLSETFQIDPEQSTVAIIVPHKKAMYFNI